MKILFLWLQAMKAHYQWNLDYDLNRVTHLRTHLVLSKKLLYSCICKHHNTLFHEVNNSEEKIPWVFPTLDLQYSHCFYSNAFHFYCCVAWVSANFFGEFSKIIPNFIIELESLSFSILATSKFFGTFYDSRHGLFFAPKFDLRLQCHFYGDISPEPGKQSTQSVPYDLAMAGKLFLLLLSFLCELSQVENSFVVACLLNSSCLLFSKSMSSVAFSS